VWAPLLVLLLSRDRRVALDGTCTLAIASFVDVVWVHHAHATTAWVFYSTDTRSGAFLAGAAPGLLWSQHHRHRHVVAPWVHANRHHHGRAAHVCRLGVRSPELGLRLRDGLVRRLHRRPSDGGRSRRSAAAEGALVSQPGHDLCRATLLPLNLWHYVWLTWLRSFGLSGVLMALLATFTCAELSWRIVESPFLRLKQRFVNDKPAGRVEVEVEVEEVGQIFEPGSLEPGLLEPGEKALKAPVGAMAGIAV
jgi:hypothetical protein